MGTARGRGGEGAQRAPRDPWRRRRGPQRAQPRAIAEPPSRGRSPDGGGGGGGPGGAGALAGIDGEGYSANSALLRSLGGFMVLEARLQAAQPALLEQIVLEAVRFERRHTQEALRVAEHRASIAQAHLKQKELLRAASGDPKPSAVARARVLTEEAALLNKAFLYLELPRLAEARLEASAELAGLLLAVRSSHGGLLTQASEAFFDACKLPQGRARAQPLPPTLRASLEPPLLLANASTILADNGSPHALIAATAAMWRPPSATASPPPATRAWPRPSRPPTGGGATHSYYDGGGYASGDGYGSADGYGSGSEVKLGGGLTATPEQGVAQEQGRLAHVRAADCRP